MIPEATIALKCDEESSVLRADLDPTPLVDGKTSNSFSIGPPPLAEMHSTHNCIRRAPATPHQLIIVDLAKIVSRVWWAVSQ